MWINYDAKWSHMYKCRNEFPFSGKGINEMPSGKKVASQKINCLRIELRSALFLAEGNRK